MTSEDRRWLITVIPHEGATDPTVMHRASTRQVYPAIHERRSTRPGACLGDQAQIGDEFVQVLHRLCRGSRQPVPSRLLPNEKRLKV
jgi:hypothetical protein